MFSLKAKELYPPYKKDRVDIVHINTFKPEYIIIIYILLVHL